MARYALLGETLGHSFSPQLHKALGGYDYELLPTPPEKVAALFQERDFAGLNVTIPYKRTVMPLCDEIDPRAGSIGAVNTVVNRRGRLVGYNTDIDGFLYQVRRSGVELKGRKVVILGSGGAGRTALAAARELGAGEIAVVSRNGADNYENLSRHAGAQVLVNATPVGMYPRCGASPVDLGAFPALTGVLDVVYNPLRTALILAAGDRGLPCSGGLPMLAAQAARAAELFTGRAVPEARTEEVLRELTAQVQNVVLIGMPGCGKSLLGKLTARKLGKTFVDVDEEIVRRAGRSIPDIFAREGERAFRDMESALVRELGAGTGQVIATGGGVVLRRENLDPLRQNGVVVHVKRSIARLPRTGRPLSQKTGPEELWRRRKRLYESFADVTVHNDGRPEDTAETIVKELKRA